MKKEINILEIKKAIGNNGAVQQNVNRFFVNIGKSVNCTIKTIIHITTDAMIK